MKKFLKKFKTISFSCRGFNLFSALVAAVLLMSGVVLVNTLISTEDKLSTNTYHMLSSFKLNDAANLARADALQSFNYNFRAQLEDYLSYNGTKFDTMPGMTLLKIKSSSEDNFTDKWDTDGGVIKTFESAILLTDLDPSKPSFDAVIRFVANKTIDNFNPGSYGRYKVDLSDRSNSAKDAVVRSIAESVAIQSARKEDFLTVVDCDEDSCPLGTFYFNIPLNEISDENYESLPRIIVTDLITKEEIKIAILPRTNLKVYIPLRFFKALHEAIKNAKVIKRMYSELDELKLGFCDTGCTPRTSANTPAIGDTWDHACLPSGGAELIEFTGAYSPPAGLPNYMPAHASMPANNAMSAYAIQMICERAGENIDEINFEDPLPSSGGVFENLNIKLEKMDPANELFNEMRDCPFNQIVAEAAHVQKKVLSNLTAGAKLYCGKIKSLSATVVYEENNPRYIVRGEKNNYKIIISATGFTPDNETSEKCNNTDAAPTSSCTIDRTP